MSQLAALVLAACLGGFAAGCIALAVGGLGVLLTFRRQLTATAHEVLDLDARLEREIKRRAADASRAAPREPSVDALLEEAKRLHSAGSQQVVESRDQILRRHGG